jgi:hypothetical protein
MNADQNPGEIGFAIAKIEEESSRHMPSLRKTGQRLSTFCSPASHLE